MEYRHPDERIGHLGTVGEFWRWAMSDMLGNRNRGILAEYLVAKLLGTELSHPRLEWDCYDLLYCNYKIEVKSSAYVQTWHKGHERSVLNFGVGPHRCWDARTNVYNPETKRWADCYVFCVFPADRSYQSRDVLDLDMWAFFVTSTINLESHISSTRKNLSLSMVKTICGEAASYSNLKTKVDTCLGLKTPN